MIWLYYHDQRQDCKTVSMLWPSTANRGYLKHKFKKVTIFQRRAKKRWVQFFYEKIDVVQSYTYLGTQIPSTGNFTLSLKHLGEKTVHALVSLRRRIDSASAVWNHLLLAKFLTQWFHLFWVIIAKSGISSSNQTSSIRTLHQKKEVTCSFGNAICKWITKLLVLRAGLKLADILLSLI